jgi:pimeloyl-CoA dehydrogenase
MDFALTDEHLALRDAVRRFCDAHYPAHTRGDVETAEVAAERHAGLAALGLTGLPIAPAHGGSGLGAVETMLVAEELGRALAASNFVPGSVRVAPLLADAGTPAQRERWLPAIAAGTVQAALACDEDGDRGGSTLATGMAPPSPPAAADAPTFTSPRAQRLPDGWRLDGQIRTVLGADAAGLLLVAARTAGAPGDRDGLSLFALDADTPGLRRQPLRLLDARGAAHLAFDDVRVGEDRLVGPAGGAAPLIEAARDRANAALCAESAGALDALLALTVEHLRTRRQFGAPLARFQALQHAVADIAIALEQIKSMACVAAMAVDGADAPERARLVSAAKTLAAQLGRRCALAAIQLHGAMGMTDECRAGHYAKRLIANGLLFGDGAHHLKRFDAHRIVLEPATPAGAVPAHAGRT